MVRFVLVVASVCLTGLVQIPLLLGPDTRRELVAVVLLLLVSLVMGLEIVAWPEGPTMGRYLGQWLEPVGTLLFGPR